MNAPETTPLYYPTIVISDFHLGKDIAYAQYLLEFLEHTTCDKLLLNGDIIDGWLLMAEKHKKMPEMHMRVLDSILKKAANGIEVVYIAGNHDENLRKRWDKAAKTIHSNKVDYDDKVNFPKISRKKYQFRDPINSNERIPLTIAKGYRHVDRNDKVHLVLHGDQFDKAMQNEFLKYMGEALDPAYDAAIKFDRANGTKIANKLKKMAKRAVGDFDAAVHKKVKTSQIDGLICGHTHDAKLTFKEGRAIHNSGDWVESCTALVEKDGGEWELIHWFDKRKELGLENVPSENDENPNQELRALTERLLRWGQRLWPARNLQKLKKKLKEAKSDVYDLLDRLRHTELSVKQCEAIVKANKKMEERQLKIKPY